MSHAYDIPTHRITMSAVAASATSPNAPARRPQLTNRQLEVAMLLRSGLRHAEIAAHLNVSQRQVARLAAQARERASATTSSHLVALIAVGSRGTHPKAVGARV